jgi:preprotein translocase subunit YajC
MLTVHREYSLQGDHCERQVPTVLAVPISYNHTGTNYNIMTDSTTTLISATLALYTIKALFQEEDIMVLGITDESDIDDEPAPQGLSLSTRIGVGIGSAIGGLLLIGLIVWLLLRKRQSKRAKMRKSMSPGAYSSNADGCAPFDAVTAVRRYVHRHQGPDVEPPLAYQSPSGGETVVVEDGDIVIERDGEIKVLKAQKAAIERRIEELEKSEPDDEREMQTRR